MSAYKPLQVYLAAPWEQRDEMLQFKKKLEDLGVYVTSTWLTPEEGNDSNMAKLKNKFHECRARALKDVEDIKAADFVVIYKPAELHRQPTTGGHHAEAGICIGLGKPFIVYGARENVFHYHPLAQLVTDFNELCYALHI